MNKLRDIPLDSDQAKEALYDLLDLINVSNQVMLRLRIISLKQNDIVDWTIGEILERALNIVDALHVSESNHE